MVSEKMEDVHKSGYTLMVFDDLEEDVVRFLENIPLEYYQSPKERERIYSPKLANILINIGSRVDEFFRNWNIIQHLAKDINRYLVLSDYKLIESLNILILNDKKLSVLAIEDSIFPFQNWIYWGEAQKFDKEGKKCKNQEKKYKHSRVYNDWWTAYNHVKHNGYNSRTEGNLNNVILSLGGLFVLNCCHQEVMQYIKEHEYGKIEKYYQDKDKVQYKVRVKSKLFYFPNDVIHNIYDENRESEIWQIEL